MVHMKRIKYPRRAFVCIIFLALIIQATLREASTNGSTFWENILRGEPLWKIDTPGREIKAGGGFFNISQNPDPQIPPGQGLRIDGARPNK